LGKNESNDFHEWVRDAKSEGNATIITTKELTIAQPALTRHIM